MAETPSKGMVEDVLAGRVRGIARMMSRVTWPVTQTSNMAPILSGAGAASRGLAGDGFAPAGAGAPALVLPCTISRTIRRSCEVSG